VNCYLCGSTEFSIQNPRVRDSDSIRVLKCKVCELVFLDNHSHISLEFYQQDGMFNHKAPDIKLLTEQEKEDTNRRVENLKKQVVNKALLDFGCGSGAVVKELSKFAKFSEAVEPNIELRRYLNDVLKIKTYESAESLDQNYDAITLFHVLEHLPDPAQMLKTLASRLNKNGFIHVEIPSADDALVSLYDSQSFKDFTYWSCHLYLFNLKNIALLAKKAELEILNVKQVQRYPLANHLYWLSKNLPGGHKIWPNLTSPSLLNAYFEALSSLGKCDTLEIQLCRV
jgi:2-polyprenyl-3-methyl-5-hydroxy-6-metoxy-1,4-benzoquinol methylase